MSKDQQPPATGVTAPASEWAMETAATGRNAGRKLLRDVRVITHCVADLELAVASWTEWLGYRIVARGELPAELCAAWQAPAAAGLPWCLLEPASGQPCFIRFIGTGSESISGGGYGPPATWGWNATELLVLDPDALALKLARSPFRILGGPGNLYPHEKAPRAMQVRGPSGELVYFTRILPGGSRYGMKGARSPVDRAFIVTCGGPSLDTMQDFYGGELGLRVMDRMPFLNAILADACGVSRQTIFPTSVARIPGRSHLVEMDEYPPHTQPRPVAPGHLPGGMAMVGFQVADLAEGALALRTDPVAIEIAPYLGRRVAAINGAAGEWIELIEDAR